MGNLLPRGCYVVLHIGTGPSRIEEKRGAPLVVTVGSNRFVLSDDIWIERLDEQLAKKHSKGLPATTFQHKQRRTRQTPYAFVRQVPAVEKSNYEGIEDLFMAIALSRLIHPTSIGDRYCARVFHFVLKDSAIQAIQYRGISPDVLLNKDHRDWLSVEDAENLRRLMPWLSKNKRMHGRIHRAYWNHEYAMR
jgi:hypothetical protein